MLKKIKRNIQQLGVINSFLYTLDKIFQILPFDLRIIKYYFVVQKLSEVRLLPKGKGRNIKVLQIPYDENCNPCPRPAEIIKSRYKQAAECYVAYQKEDFAASLWCVKNKYQEDEVRCLYKMLNSNIVWDFDVFVVPKYRLSLVFMKLWQEVVHKLLMDGVEYSVSRISAFNSISLSSHMRLGAKIVGSATFICIGPLQLTLSSLFPYFHFSFHSGNVPVFYFNFNNE